MEDSIDCGDCASASQTRRRRRARMPTVSYVVVEVLCKSSCKYTFTMGTSWCSMALNTFVHRVARGSYAFSGSSTPLTMYFRPSAFFDYAYFMFAQTLLQSERAIQDFMADFVSSLDEQSILGCKQSHNVSFDADTGFLQLSLRLKPSHQEDAGLRSSIIHVFLN